MKKKIENKCFSAKKGGCNQRQEVANNEKIDEIKCECKPGNKPEEACCNTTNAMQKLESNCCCSAQQKSDPETNFSENTNQKDVSKLESNCCCNDNGKHDSGANISESTNQKNTSKSDSNYCCSTKQKSDPETNCCGGAKENDSSKSELCCNNDKQKCEPKLNCCGIAKSSSEQKLGCSGIGETSKNGDVNCCGIAKSSSEIEFNCCGIAHAPTKAEMNCCGIASSKNKTRGKLKSIITNPWFKLAVSLASIIISIILSSQHIYDKANIKGIKILDLAWIAIIISGYPIYKGAFISLFKHKRITSALLISVAMSASILMGILNSLDIGSAMHGGSYFFAAGEIAFLMALGETIESITVAKARSGITDLIKLAPTIAALKVGDQYNEVKVESLKVGDIVLIKPNEIIPIDGKVIDGASSVDQSNITGEYTPIDVSEGMEIYAGTRNLNGSLEIKVTKRSEDTSFSKLVEYIRTSESKKAPIVKLADKSAKVLVLSAIAVSLLVFIVSFFALKAGSWDALQRAATILVVVCPCAFALATPIAISAAIGNSSRKGVLVKNGEALEILGKVKTVAFDKTGTLTKGELNVDHIFNYNIEKEDFLKLVVSAERKSEHPIARAIIKSYSGEYYDDVQVQSLVGSGLKATINGKVLEITKLQGNEERVPKSEINNINQHGKTLIVVFSENKYIGSIALSDTIKEESKDTIKDLQEMSINTVMLTGDNQSVAETIANEIGLSQFYSDLLPEDKVAVIEKIKQSERVAMVGDGINDGPALVASSCSIAMGGMGNSVVMQTADITLMKDDISKVPFLIKLSKRTLNTIKINIAISLLISILAVILSTLGKINVVLGALLHNLSSVLVCLNSAFLLTYKGGRKAKSKNIAPMSL